jgi:hypothetical protein
MDEAFKRAAEEVNIEVKFPSEAREVRAALASARLRNRVNHSRWRNAQLLDTFHA